MVAVLRTGSAFCLHIGHRNCRSDGRGRVTHCSGLTRRSVFGRTRALSRSKTRRRKVRASWAGERLCRHARRLDIALSRRVFETMNTGMATVVEGNRERPPVMPSAGISMAGAMLYSGGGQGGSRSPRSPPSSSAAISSISMHTAQVRRNKFWPFDLLLVGTA